MFKFKNTYGKSDNNGRCRYKNPNVYTWRTNENTLKMLQAIADRQQCFKCDVLEVLVTERFEDLTGGDTLDA